MKAQAPLPPNLATKPGATADTRRFDEGSPPQASGFEGLLHRSRERRVDAKESVAHKKTSHARLEDALQPRTAEIIGGNANSEIVVHAAPCAPATPAQSSPLPQTSAPRVYPPPVPVDEMHRPVMECVRSDAPRLQLRLHPPELGPMTLSVSLEDSMLELVFEAGSAAAVEALRGGLHALRVALAQHGLVLADCSIRLLQSPRQALTKHHEVSAVEADADHQENTP